MSPPFKISPIIWIALFFASTFHPSVWAKFPEPNAWKTANGANVRFVHAPEIDIVDIRLIFDAGSARDGDQFGLASLTSELLSKGTESLNEEALHEKMDALGVRWGSSSLRDMAIINFRSLTRSELMQPALKILGDVISKPAFSKPIIERTIKNRNVTLKASQSRAGETANRLFWQALYQDHPYAHDPLGTLVTLAKLKRADIQKFHRTYYVASNLDIAIVGNLSMEQAKKIAEQLSNQLPAGKPPEPIASPKRLDNSKIFDVPFNSQQAHIHIGTLGVSRHEEQRHYIALYIANFLLGGDGLVSDLAIEIREKNGLAYSVYSHFTPMQQNGPFRISLQTKNSQASTATELVFKVVEQLIGTLDDERVNQAKESIAGRFVLGLDSNQEMVGYVGMMAFYGLSNSYLNDFNKHLAQIKAAEVKTAFTKFLQSNPFMILRLGQVSASKPAAKKSQ